MPKIERYICVRYENTVFEINNCFGSDFKAKLEAGYEVERRLNKQRGGLKKHFLQNPDDIWLVLK